MSGAALPRRRWGRVLAAFALGAIAWTLVVCYPNPAIFFRNLGRYRHLPVDPGLAGRMKWATPERPAEIEGFVEGLLIPASDWRLYRVPWYVPTPREAAEAMRGDCEAKTMILASLLAERKIPFEIKASFNHIWVEYQGRPARPGEAAETAYLTGREGRLAIRMPRAVQWGELYAMEKQLLWEEMPPFRRLVWLVGLLWLVLLILGRTARVPGGDYVSHWQPSRSGYVVRSLLAGTLLLVGLVSLPPDAPGAPIKWLFADLAEGAACCAVGGAFLVWLLTWHLTRRPMSVSVHGDGLVAHSLWGGRARRRELTREEIRHVELDAVAHPARPWRVFAMRRDGRRTALLDYREEIEARRAWRSLGAQLNLPLVMQAEGAEIMMAPMEMGRPLRERLGPGPREGSSPRPNALDLVVEASDGEWTLRYPRVARGVRWMLLVIVLLPAGLFAFTSWLVMGYGESRVLWMAWALAGALLSMIVYIVIVLREEMVARLGEAKVEIAGGVLRFHRPDGRVEQMPLEEIESVELGRKGGAPSIAVVSPERVIHIVGLGAEEERGWVRDAVEGAIVEGGRVGAQL